MEFIYYENNNFHFYKENKEKYSLFISTLQNYLSKFFLYHQNAQIQSLQPAPILESGIQGYREEK